MQKLRKISVKTRAGTFVLEMSSKGLWAVRFPVFSRVTSGTLTFSRTMNVPAFKKIRKMKLDLTGYTPFQAKVYAALRKVRAGQTVTYGELARRAGYPGAARAVGSAMKKNRLPIIVPCHRVLPAVGGLGEYSAGKKWKRWLLEYELKQDGGGRMERNRKAKA
ncbi:MAG: MGMT family protein [Candidatus Omnitrophota bacterium]